MDIVAIHTALVEIWPNGIPRDAYVALAGIFKVCSDLEMAALREKVQDEAIAEGDLAKFMNAIPFTHHSDGRKIKREVKAAATPLPARPTTPKIDVSHQKRAFVSVKTMESVKTLLVAGARTKAYIEKALSLSPRAVRYALAALRDRGLVKRIPGKAKEPHTFCLV